MGLILTLAEPLWQLNEVIMWKPLALSKGLANFCLTWSRGSKTLSFNQEHNIFFLIKQIFPVYCYTLLGSEDSSEFKTFSQSDDKSSEVALGFLKVVFR